VQIISEVLGTVCGAIPLESGLIVGLFLAGAAGSPLHCGPMCGGFVLGQVADRLAAIPAGGMCERHRLGAAMLLPYHAGRVLTYALLGAVAGIGGAALAEVPYLMAALMMVAAGLFLMMAWRRGRGLFGRTRRAERPLTLVRRVPVGGGLPPTPALPLRGAGSRTGWMPLSIPWGTPRGVSLGLLLGFLPCGFVYGGLAAAAASHDPLTGALGMAAFGVGTMPALIAVGIAGHAAGRKWQAAIASIAPFVLVVNAALLVLLAVKGLLAA
jgi:sulfite exporter TauE/SafE